MKGLLTKDIHLLLRQKNTLLLMVLILALISRHGLEFTLGYFILLSFSLGNSTIGYDAAERIREYTMNAVNGSSKTGLGAGIVGSWLVIMASSILCSVAIMKKKEF